MEPHHNTYDLPNQNKLNYGKTNFKMESLLWLLEQL